MMRGNRIDVVLTAPAAGTMSQHIVSAICTKNVYTACRRGEYQNRPFGEREMWTPSPETRPKVRRRPGGGKNMFKLAAPQQPPLRWRGALTRPFGHGVKEGGVRPGKDFREDRSTQRIRNFRETCHSQKETASIKSYELDISAAAADPKSIHQKFVGRAERLQT